MMYVIDKIAACLWPVCSLVAFIGCAYAVFAALLIKRSAFGAPEACKSLPSVTILKPLCGEEVGLEENLASFCAQDYNGPLQIVFGVHDRADPAAALAGRLVTRFPDIRIDVLADARVHGPNRKISNVANMMKLCRHEMIVLSDSDMRVDRAYLARVVDALDAPEVGAVTCLYRGLPSAGFWSRLAATAIDQHFLPNVLVGLKLGLARPCFGSTIALSAETLRRIGGFERFADRLDDDYAIGAAVRELGLAVAVPPMVVDHICSERTFMELAAHELRWARTIRLVDPLGYAGSVVTHASPFAIAAAALGGLDAASLALVAFALASRLAISMQVARVLGGGLAPITLSPLRDLLSFAIFLASFLPGSVSWRGRRYRVDAGGTLTPT